MGLISGLWASRQQGQDYSDAGKWGDGYHPIHESRDAGRGRAINSKLSAAPEGDPAPIDMGEFVDAPIDWLGDSYSDGQDGSDDYPYMGQRGPRWGDCNDRDDTDPNSSVPWGADAEPVRATSFGVDRERQTPVMGFGGPVSGGWANKSRGALALSEAQAVPRNGYQLGINTSDVQGQGVRTMANERAVTRGTDDPRAEIRSRTAGQVLKEYALSFSMGGGPAAPDMSQQPLSVGLKRPFFFRTAATPPDEDHQYNEMESRTPIMRSVPADPWTGDAEDSGDDGDNYESWGY